MGVMSKISVGSCYNYTNYCLKIISSLAEWKRKVENASANKPKLHLDLYFSWFANIMSHCNAFSFTSEVTEQCNGRSTAWKLFNYVTHLNSTTNQERRRSVNCFGRGDYFNGKRIWIFKMFLYENIFSAWLNYQALYNLLLQAGRRRFKLGNLRSTSSF